MNENSNVAMAEANQQDSFLSGWNDEAEAAQAQEPAENAPEEADEQTQQEHTEAETTAEDAEPAAEQAAETTDGQAPERSDAIAWDVKHMGEQRTMRAADITPELLQKGLDYDRVRAAYDDAKPVVEILRQYAKDAGMTLGDYAKMIRAKAKESSGMSEADAKRTVELEDREAAISERERQEQETATAEQAKKDKMQSDLREFAAVFPDVYKQAEQDPKAIPAEVWESVNGGLSLTAAYARHAISVSRQQVQEAQRAAAAAEQNAKNSERSTGSMASASTQHQSADAFLQGFDS